MRFLKTNTATRVTVGPFLDKGDGITPETALTATNEHLTLVVDDGGVPTLVLDANATASGGTNDMVHVTNDDAGLYDLELTAAQLNYVGRAILSINYVTDHLPVFHEFMILSASAYDFFFGTGKLPVDVDTIKTQAVTCAAGVTVRADVGTAAQSTAQTGDTYALANGANGFANIKSDTAAILTDTATTIPSLLPAALVGGRIDASVGAVAANAITAAAIAAGAIDNATFAADVGSTAFATNIMAQAVFKALDSAIGDGVSLTADGLLDKIRTMGWIVRNKITVLDANGDTVIYKDNSTTQAFTVSAMLTDNVTTTTRLRAE